MTHAQIELDRGHAQRILQMVDAILTAAGLRLSMLDAIAFGRGPGGFTGVRLAVSVAQGLAFGADLPVVGISDLRAVAQRLNQAHGEAMRVIVCNDARMSEVYWGCYERGADKLMWSVGDEHVSKPIAVRIPDAWSGRVAGVWGAGRGFAAYPELARQVGLEAKAIASDLLPRATEIAALAVVELRGGRATPAEQAVPVYLRDDVARPKP